MNLAASLKNHQGLWGAGVGGLILVLFVGGLVWASVRPFETDEEGKELRNAPESSSTSSSTARSALSDSSSSSQEGSSEDTTNPLASQTGVHGTITNIASADNTVRVRLKNVPEQSEYSSLSISVNTDTPITLIQRTSAGLAGERTTEPNSAVSTTPLSFGDLRDNDEVIVTLTQPIGETSATLEAARLRVLAGGE